MVRIFVSSLLVSFDKFRLDSVYRLPVQSPSTTAKEIKSRALSLQPVLEEVQVKHPLVRDSVLPLVGVITNSLHSLPRKYTL